MNLEFQSAISEYWKAVGAKGDPPLDAESEFDAFIEALGISAKNEHAFELSPPMSRFYADIALNPESGETALRWAAELAELETFFSPADTTRTYLVDTQPDKTGNHRVYSWGSAGRNDVEFWSLSSVLRWMTLDVQERAGAIAADSAKAAKAHEEAFIDDDWESGGHSGMAMMEELLGLPLGQAWQDLAHGNWPVLEGTPAPQPRKKDATWQRQMAVWLIFEFIQHRHVRLPATFKKEELSRANRALFEHLTEFEEAIAFGAAPRWMFDLAVAEDSKLARFAEMWIQDFQSSRKQDDLPPEDGDDADAGAAAAAEVPELPPEEQTPFQKQLTVVIAKMLDEMVARGEIELQEERKEDLTHELVIAASDARSMDHMIKRIAGTLIDSSLVDELYANDDQIHRDLRARFGAR